MRDERQQAAALATWYRAHARALPWREPPGSAARADPYRVWLSEIMLQQTTVAAVKGYFERFTRRWPTVAALAAAPDAEVMAAWAGLGYYARARNLLACARMLTARHGGRFPPEPEALRALPGIGPYTAAAIGAIAFGRPEVVVDGNVERVMARLHDIATPLPTAKPELVAAAARMTPDKAPGDHAQALMDLGATICTPRNPACTRCPLRSDCLAYARCTACARPVHSPKPPKPTRHGLVHAGRRADGAWLVERRPPRGLLGGMLGFPGSDWDRTGQPAPAPPLPGGWHQAGTEVRHTFTHFHLRLNVLAADLPDLPAPERLLWAEALEPESLPGLMRKALAQAEKLLGPVERRSGAA